MQTMKYSESFDGLEMTKTGRCRMLLSRPALVMCFANVSWNRFNQSIAPGEADIMAFPGFCVDSGQAPGACPSLGIMTYAERSENEKFWE